MIRQLICFVLLMTIGAIYAQSENTARDPLSSDYTLLSSAELMFVWKGFDNEVGQRMYDYENQAITPKTGFYRDSTLYGEGTVDVITGDWDGDSDDDIVFAWEGADSSLVLSLPLIDPETLDWTDVKTVTLGSVLKSTTFRQFRLVALNIDQDFETEFLVAYVDEDEKIHIKLFETDELLNASEVTSIADIVLPVALGDLAMFDIAAGDLDGDFDEEIVLVASEENVDGSGNWGIITQVYDYDSDAHALRQKGSQTLYRHADNTTYNNYSLNRLRVATGDLDGKDAEEGIVQVQVGQAPYYVASYLQPFCISETLEEIVVPENSLHFLGHSNVGVQGAMNVITGDLDNDGRDEIAAGDKLTLWVLDSDTTFALTTAATTWLSPQSDQAETRTIAIRDMDADPSDPLNINKPELVIGINYQGDQEWVHIRVLHLNTANGTLDQQSEIEDELSDLTGSPTVRQMAFVAGDFDGDAFRVGRPKHFTKTEILQPMVILNAPPVHFDVINDTVYDVSLSFNNNESEFVATYETQSGLGTEVQTQVHADWAISRELSTSASAYGLSANASIKKRFGERFSNFSSTSEIVTVNVRVDARDDDYIYATVAEYDIWEYPVINNREVQDGRILIVLPKLTENRWFPSKSWSGHSYVPNHEVGNILSYREYVNLEDNEDLAERIKGTTSESFSLDGNSSIDWGVRIEDFSESGASTSREVGVEMSADGGGGFGPFTINAGVTSSYSSEDLSTHKVTVSDLIELNVHLDQLDLSLGETIYNVTPYAYWAKNGALVIDYAVRPEEAEPGFTETWWQVNYGDKPDPAFALPWRYDPEKGNALQFEEKRYQTKEIAFAPLKPQPGDTILIEARIHNYSLITTGSATTVRFYVGDPDNGGTVIVGTDGETDVSTLTPIDRRGQAIVSLEWAVPADLDPFARIYAVIDPENEHDEIHENNNKGWTVFNSEGVTTGIEVVEQPTLPQIATLRQNYPNPFNPSTTIVFDVAASTPVTLEIFNVLGQRVSIERHASLAPGSYQYVWDATDMGGNPVASGMYFYRLQTGQLVQTRKMLLVR